MNSTHQYIGPINNNAVPSGLNTNSSLDQYKLSASSVVSSTCTTNDNSDNFPKHGSNDGMGVRSTISALEDFY